MPLLSKESGNEASHGTSAWKEALMLQLSEMDDRVPLADQLTQEVGPIILINTFRVAPEDADALLEAWTADAAYLKGQAGFIAEPLDSLTVIL